MTWQGHPGAPALYENYPGELLAPLPAPRFTGGARRGAVAGMAAAVLTAVSVIPQNLVLGGEVPVMGWISLLGVIGCVAAAVGAAPGALVGGLLTVLARRGTSDGLQRSLGGVAAAGAAALVLASYGASGLPGVVIATLCGGFAAPWVAWGSDRPTLA